MAASTHRPFSLMWVFLSMGIYIGVELILGGWIGKHLIGRYMSISLRFTMQGLLHVGSYFIGGIVVGLFSPGIRIREPAIGAFLAVFGMLLMSAFTPYSFIRMSFTKLLIGGAIAFVCALAGARIGEKLSGNIE